jgi:hypothetical protein
VTTEGETLPLPVVAAMQTPGMEARNSRREHLFARLIS